MTKFANKSRELNSLIIRGVNEVKIARTIVNMGDVLCPCRINLLRIKWKHWIGWHNKYALTLQSMGREELFKSMEATNAAYVAEYKEDNTLSIPLLKTFESIHSIVFAEFKHQLLEEFPDTYLKGIVFVGELLTVMAQNSIFELTELKVSCQDLPGDSPCEEGSCSFECANGFLCHHHEESKEDSSRKLQFAIIVNDMFNINSFATKKLRHLSKHIFPDKAEVIFDFSHYREVNLVKMKRMLAMAKDLFGEISISDANPEILAFMDSAGYNYKKKIPIDEPEEIVITGLFDNDEPLKSSSSLEV